MEEKYFYDILQEVPEAEHDDLEAVNEHQIIELIIKDAEGFPREHEHFPIKIEGLGEYTESICTVCKYSTSRYIHIMGRFGYDGIARMRFSF